MTTQNIEIVRGNIVTLLCTVVDDDDAAVDLSNYEAWFTAKKVATLGDDNASIGPIEGAIAGVSDNEITFDFDEEDTAVAYGEYYYDVTVNYYDGLTLEDRKTVTNGKLTVVQNINAFDGA